MTAIAGRDFTDGCFSSEQKQQLVDLINRWNGEIAEFQPSAQLTILTNIVAAYILRFGNREADLSEFLENVQLAIESNIPPSERRS
jgi:hypothetical protein